MTRPPQTKSGQEADVAYRAEIEKKGKERLQALEQLQGMWKDRKPDPINELQEMRKEWERDLP